MAITISVSTLLALSDQSLSDLFRGREGGDVRRSLQLLEERGVTHVNSRVEEEPLGQGLVHTHVSTPSHQ